MAINGCIYNKVTEPKNFSLAAYSRVHHAVCCCVTMLSQTVILKFYDLLSPSHFVLDDKNIQAVQLYKITDMKPAN
jgi:hypothetical protein